MPTLKRTLTPEILDSLPEGHPDAMHNRRDLRIFNALMGNFSWVAKTLQQSKNAGEPILELGAGDGSFGAFLAKRYPKLLEHSISGLDLWSRPDSWPQTWGWIQEDILETRAFAEHPIVIGNMILHQFEEDLLRAVGKSINEHARLLIFNETARSRLSLTLLPLTRLLGTNYVSNHDAKVSVESGFRGDELPELLGLDPTQWTWKTHSTLMGAYRFVAWKS
ncbi:MAG: class I SAM-dependent methyltransferase [Opitutales bacterium]